MKKLAALFLFLLSCAHGFAQSGADKQQPKLVVGIVVDQMRYDYLYRFADKYGKGGFKRMLAQGFECRNAHFNYVPTYTGPGHAAIYTGTTPAYNGIVGNDWYERSAGRSVYVTEDTSARTTGSVSNAGKMSPHRLASTTITDELRLSNNRQSKVLGICLKDRGSILPAGHIPSAAYWFDNTTGGWITSDYYLQELPQWVKDFNGRQLSDQYLSSPWNTLFPIETYNTGLENGGPFRNAYKGENQNRFPHDLPAIKKEIGYELLRRTPFGNSYTVDFALEAIRQEQLGQGNYTDFLALSFSSTDYIGHQFGIHAIETQDCYARLDRELERLFNYLDKTIGKENVLIFLSSDHGAAENPAHMQSLKIPAGVFSTGNLVTELNTALSVKYGDGKWVLHYDNQQLWLNHELMAAKKADRKEIIAECVEILGKKAGVYRVYATDVLMEIYPGHKQVEIMQKGIYPSRSGDIALLLLPGWFDGEYAAHGGTTHGSGYMYDTHIPLLFMGWHIQKGTTSRPVYITDIAPTISDLLHISRPNACIGNPVGEAIK